MEILFQSAKQALSKTWIYISIISAIVTILGIIRYDELFASYICRILFVGAIFLLVYAIAILKCYFQNGVTVSLGNSRSVCVEFGDLFSKQGIIIVPFNRYFDTIVNNKDILFDNSIAAQFIKHTFSGNLGELDNQIAEITEAVKLEKTVEKPGKKKAYPIGTVVKVQNGANYYCVALTDVDEHFKSVCDIEMLHKSIVEVLKFINREAGGKKVYMPLLGSGFSRLNKDKQVILEYLISILKASDIPIQSELHIVLRKEEREKFDLTKFT